MGKRTEKRTNERTEKQSDLRDQTEARILRCAIEVFAESGYAGSSLANIADRAGLSKQNLLYYFSSKQALYLCVLDQILDQWLEKMDILADESQEPASLLRSYIAAKLRFSREQPQASRVYAMEVISGAPVYGHAMQKKIQPLMQKDIAIFERWISEGKMAALNPAHLLFSIWAMTQSYADFSTQMGLVLGHTALQEQDFQAAEDLITDLVLSRLHSNPTVPQRA